VTTSLLLAYGWPGLVLLTWIGLSIGSFLNVVVHRVPLMLERDWRQQARSILDMPDEAEDEGDGEPFNLIVPRSRCPGCGHQITALENIPIVSWLYLRGKCSACGTKISVRYPGVELLTGGATVFMIATFGFTWLGLATCLFTWMLIALTFIDFDTTLLPDQITYPILWLGLLTNYFGGIVALHDAVIGALVGYLFLWGTYWAFKLATGKEGMGHGDFKLFAGLGAWLGWTALPGTILVAAIAGLVYALGRIVTKAQASSEPIPFGPFLAVAGWVTLVFRDSVLGVFQP
jgi:leader peptidase (prepilin peptidase)/N-methyltransferase